MGGERIEFFRHNLGAEEIEACVQVLHSLFHTSGPACSQFEEAFASYLGVDHAVTVSSCTAGLELALQALGVGQGDEVVTTPLTFIATLNACLKVGARPVLVDVEPLTGNLRADLLESVISPRTKVIIPVHLYGLMCDMRAMRAIADRHGLALVADCAHAVEARRDGLGPADLVEASCYSFYTTKSLSCGEGGAVATNSPQLAERLKILRLHGMSKGAVDRYTKAYMHWDMLDLGSKANLPDILAALLLPQLAKLEGWRTRREEISLRYEEAFADLPGVSFPTVPPGARSARHLFTIWVNQRDLFLRLLEERGVGVAVNYRPVHLLTYYRENFGYRPGDFPVAEDIGDRTLTLPLYPKLTDRQCNRVIEAVREVALAVDLAA